MAMQPTSHESQGAIGSMVYAEIKDFKKSLTSLLTNNEQFKADILESIRTSVFELSNEISTAKESQSVSANESQLRFEQHEVRSNSCFK
jgi:hypothetical protein